ncbi:MAG TPA: thioredoxin family protein [Phycisphaerae bacterium]|nr:thioredoxin family protein [Phycisphaerae bacterium]
MCGLRRRILFVLVTGLVGTACSGCSDILWSGNLAGAQRQAAKDGRLVLVYYWSWLNEDCDRMDRTVFNDQAVIDTMAGTIPVRLDAAFHRRWARERGIERLPSFVIYSPDGAVISTRQGTMNEGQFRAFVVSGKLNR